MSAKVDYVRQAIAQAHTGGHHCHWPGCNEKVPPATWGCKKHWYRLPPKLRAKIWLYFRPGQEITKTPDRNYVEAAREVQNWIEENMTPLDRGWKYDL